MKLSLEYLGGEFMLNEIGATCYGILIFAICARIIALQFRDSWAIDLFLIFLAINFSRQAVLRVATDGGNNPLNQIENKWIRDIIASDWLFFTLAVCLLVSYFIYLWQLFKKKRG